MLNSGSAICDGPRMASSASDHVSQILPKQITIEKSEPTMPHSLTISQRPFRQVFMCGWQTTEPKMEKMTKTFQWINSSPEIQMLCRLPTGRQDFRRIPKSFLLGSSVSGTSETM